MSEELKLASLPYALIRRVQDLDGDVNAVETEVCVDYPELDLTKQQVRELVSYATQEKELDQLAGAPSDISVLSRKVDMVLNKEIDAILEENRVLTGIVNADPSKKYLVHGEYAVITVPQAKERLSLNLKKLLDIKRAISDDKKSEGKDGGTNIQINMGEIVASALTKVKEVEAQRDSVLE